jgi:hypothetical protein
MRSFGIIVFGSGALLLSVLCSSCQSIMLGVMGMKQPKPLEDAEVIRLAERWHLDSGGVFVMDTAFVYRLRNDTNGNDRLSKAMIQPAQVRVYDENDTLIAIMANCHVGGFPNVKWERSTWHTAFPPPTGATIDSAVVFTSDAHYFRPLGTSALVRNAGRPAVVFVWTRFMGRQTRRLEEYSRQIRSTWPQADWYYVNMEGLFLDLE